MAADHYVIENLVRVIEITSKKALQECEFHEQLKNTLFRKKSKDLKSGDVILPRGCIKTTNDQQTKEVSLLPSSSSAST